MAWKESEDDQDDYSACLLCLLSSYRSSGWSFFRRKCHHQLACLLTNSKRASALITSWLLFWRIERDNQIADDNFGDRIDDDLWVRN